MLILSNVIQVFENFTYHREFASEDGQHVVLEFSASIGDRQLKGVDMIHFDEQGRIVDLEVMVRPFSGLQALGASAICCRTTRLEYDLNAFKKPRERRPFSLSRRTAAMRPRLRQAQPERFQRTGV